MNVLIVHAHPEPKSFNGALTRTAVKKLREQGHTVEVSDLYAMKWKPAADADDCAGLREDQSYLRIDREQT
jgi:NAD(P)H dehydrogenase (quinone)